MRPEEFLIVGAVLEIVGFALTVWDYMETRQRVSAYLRRPQTISPGLIRSNTKVFAPTVRGGKRPTRTPPVTALERPLPELEGQLGEGVSLARDHADTTAQTVDAAARQREAELSGLLVWITQGGRRVRITGFAFLALGLLATLTGTVAGG